MTVIPPAATPVPFACPEAAIIDAARDVLAARTEGSGVSITIEHDFDELLRINDAARAAGTWDAIIRTVDPRFRRLDASNAFWLAGRDQSGDVVSVQSAALLDCTASSWGERFIDLTLFYDEPASDAPHGEWARCDSRAALTARGRLVWTLGGWTRPDYRRRGLLRGLNRLAKIEAWGRWRPDAFVGVVEWDVTGAWSPDRVGRRYLDPEPLLTWNMPENGLTRLHFMQFGIGDFLDDMVRVSVDDIRDVA